MAYKDFLRLLSLWERTVFTTGTLVDKLGARAGYSKLRKNRNILARAEVSGFTYSREGGNLVLTNGKTKVFLRTTGSDYDVFRQVFVQDEYLPVISYMVDNGIQPRTIIDAGSNIGLTTLKLAEKFENARIFCLEPDPQNFEQLKRNIAQFGDRITGLPVALWNKEEELFLDFGFRDGKEWSRSVTSNAGASKTSVNGVTIASVMRKYHLERIDLLKIDIEGSETKVLHRDADHSFLKQVKVLAIEIHDEFNCRQDIYDVLRSYNFEIFNADEMTMAVNRSI